MICGKTIYPTREEASNAMRGLNSSMKVGKNKLKSSYFCTECNGWHLSSGFKQSKSKRIPYVINDDINSSQRNYKNQVTKSRTKNITIHDRLTFKVK